MLTLLHSGTEQNILKQGHGCSKLERKETLIPVSESWVGKEWASGDTAAARQGFRGPSPTVYACPSIGLPAWARGRLPRACSPGKETED